MTTADRTPADLVITPRNLQFGRGETHSRWWNGGDPVSTAFYNAMSLTFPLGEAFFIESVRHYRADVPDKLRAQIADFIRQEGVHSREHVEFNRHVTDAGYDISTLEARLKERLREQRAMGKPLLSLTVTACLEHFTAILANVWLKDDRHFADASKDIKDLWRWHAIEEVEHKAVAYDTFLFATRNMSPLMRYFIRIRVMLRVTRRFNAARMRDVGDLLRQDGMGKVASWVALLRFLWSKPGLYRQIVPAWLAFFKPGFHPWDIDDRYLIADAEERLAVAA